MKSASHDPASYEALSEVSDIAKTIASQADKKAQVIFGAIEDKEAKKGEIKVLHGLIARFLMTHTEKSARRRSRA